MIEEAEPMTSSVEEAKDEDVDEPEVANAKHSVVREAYEMFVSHFGSVNITEIHCSVAPGRVNLIGEHIDYADGFVLPMNIPYYTVVIGRPASDQDRAHSIIYSTHFCQSTELKLPYQESAKTASSWARYVGGVLAVANSTRSYDILVHNTLPIGAGLSSSASVELATLYFMDQFELPAMDRSRLDSSLLCRKAEHEYAHVPCGYMDQMVIGLGRSAHALLIDCRSLHTTHIPLVIAPSAIFLITNSGVKHELASGEYAKRKTAIDEALKRLEKSSWRDVDVALLEANKEKLDGKMYDYALHVVEETERTEKAAFALLDNNLALFGKLMTDSHCSLRDKYNVSCQEIDQLVDLALSVDGVYGSRITGGGFGGCTISLCSSQKVAELKEKLLEEYSHPQSLSFLECQPVGGVSSASLGFLASVFDSA
ncbi:hypothetical protein WR25_10828 [Diploscapter pachys]|uniref:Galactokinase n=1 Tax=Diploscapter pachys TaxID=2018661 RepID=A0A2A2JAU6_9BILA|nr:hypothetical protein WR25_10828 [Diploscapter pachys]